MEVALRCELVPPSTSTMGTLCVVSSPTYRRLSALLVLQSKRVTLVPLIAPKACLMCTLFNLFLLLLKLGALTKRYGFKGHILTVPAMGLAAALGAVDINVALRLAKVPIRSDPLSPCCLKMVTRRWPERGAPPTNLKVKTQSSPLSSSPFGGRAWLLFALQGLGHALLFYKLVARFLFRPWGKYSFLDTSPTLLAYRVDSSPSLACVR